MRESPSGGMWIRGIGFLVAVVKAQCLSGLPTANHLPGAHLPNCPVPGPSHCWGMEIIVITYPLTGEKFIQFLAKIWRGRKKELAVRKMSFIDVCFSMYVRRHNVESPTNMWNREECEAVNVVWSHILSWQLRYPKRIVAGTWIFWNDEHLLVEFQSRESKIQKTPQNAFDLCSIVL